jgi:hypothetical protein
MHMNLKNIFADIVHHKKLQGLINPFSNGRSLFTLLSNKIFSLDTEKTTAKKFRTVSACLELVLPSCNS